MDRDYDYDKTECVPFEELKGKTVNISGLEVGSEQVTFECESGEKYTLTYYNDCCASCSVEDVCGDVGDIVGSPILLAEEISSKEPNEGTINERRAEYEKEKAEYETKGHKFYYDSYEDWDTSRHESETWEFYKLSTIKGSVTIRWYGSSNGYYSESATFERVKP